jgi:endoglucanase Acf2
MKNSLAVLVLLLALCESSSAQNAIVKVGEGSYTTAQPAGTKAPPKMIFQTENFQGKMPTNQWWSSLSWSKFPNRQYPHPLAITAEPAGLRVYYPGSSITVSGDKKRFSGQMPEKSQDLILGHSEQATFPEALIDGHSDWFVDVRFGTAEKGMKVSYGHGSPFVFALYEGGSPKVTFAKTAKVWSGDEKSAVLGVTVDGRHYGLFGPTGSTWSGLDSKVFTSKSDGKKYFSVAVLPDSAVKTLELFTKYAYSHITDTKVDWNYDPAASTVRTWFTVTTTAHEGPKEAQGTLFALYPHQWRNATWAKSAKLSDKKGQAASVTLAAPQYQGEYDSVRGKMKITSGYGFLTEMKYTGTLPSLPVTAGVDKDKLTTYLKSEIGSTTRGFGNTYDDGKWLGRYAQLVPLAEQCGQAELAGHLRDKVRIHLEGWLSATPGKSKGLFYHDSNWGTLIGYPASYGSDVPCNDHHFHYGYFIKAAGEIARHDPAWGKDERWGGMIKLLVRDIANTNRDDKMFPFMRCYDPYAGHSWASGDAKFADGNNQESSSEAMNAWSGMILFGEATGNKAMRDLGVCLFTTEMNAIHEYWFDVHGENFPKGFTKPAIGILWGANGSYGTWFSAAPVHIQGINWLPIHGGSLYLGNYPTYVDKNFSALPEEGNKDWQDLIWMYRALSNPADAVKLYEAGGSKIGYFGGNGRANTYSWVYALNDLGQVDAAVTADVPMYAVFRKGKARTYVVYNMTEGPRTVAFSDGFQLRTEGKGFAMGKGKD